MRFADANEKNTLIGLTSRTMFMIGVATIAPGQDITVRVSPIAECG